MMILLDFALKITSYITKSLRLFYEYLLMKNNLDNNKKYDINVIAK